MDQPDPLEFYLSNWAAYMHRPGLELGVNIGAIYCGAGNNDFESMCESLDLRLAEAVAAIVDNDLKPAPRCAVYHRYLHAVYRFPRGNYPEILEDGREAVRNGLIIKGLYVA